MKKLLYITTNIHNSGGVAKVLSVKLNYLVRKLNYKVYVLNTNGSFDETFFEFDSQIQFHYIGGKKFKTRSIRRYCKALNTEISKINPDIIINTDNGLKGSLLPYLINNNIPVIYERHVGKKLTLTSWTEKLKFKLANYLAYIRTGWYQHFIVLNNLQAQEWKGHNIKVIPNPIEFKELGSDKTFNKVAISVGRFSPEKEYGRLLNLWSEITSKCPDWKLKIYGEGNKSSYLMILKKLKIEANVVLLEPIKRIDEAYECADLYLSASSSESFGLSIAEALSFGLPVVAFETSGAKSLITNEQNGFIVAQKSNKDFMNNTVRLINEEALRNSMSEEARKGLKKYAVDKVMKSWVDLFEAL